MGTGKMVKNVEEWRVRLVVLVGFIERRGMHESIEVIRVSDSKTTTTIVRNGPKTIDNGRAEKFVDSHRKLEIFDNILLSVGNPFRTEFIS